MVNGGITQARDPSQAATHSNGHMNEKFMPLQANQARSKAASMPHSEALKNILVELQADLHVNGALDLAEDIKEILRSPARPSPTPHQIAVYLMSKMEAKDGTPIQWRIPGQKYPQIIRATRVILEHVLRKNVVLEGTPRGHEVKIDIREAATDLMACQGGAEGTQSSTQSDSQPSTYPDTDAQTTPRSKRFCRGLDVTPTQGRGDGTSRGSSSPLVQSRPRT